MFDSSVLSLGLPCEMSEKEYMELLSQVAELNMNEQQLELWDAARYNEPDIVRAILNASTDIINDQHPDSGNTALHMASANGNLTIVRLLLHHGADAQLANAAGNTPLHWAASNGQEDVCKVLLENKTVDVLKRNEFGRSALTEGFSSGREGVVQSLLEHESASEERLLSTSETGNDGKDQSVIHDMIFSNISIKVREKPMALSVDDAILGSASEDTTGLGVWPASLVAAQWLAQELTAKPQTILELGAGCGVPSLVAASVCKDARVYATDWNNLALENLQYNIDQNHLTVSAHCMDWSEQSSWPQEKIDLIIGSDLIYTLESVPLLVSTIRGLLSPGGRFLYTAPASLARQGKEEFLKLMQDHFTVNCREAPSEFAKNPLASGDDEECFLHFNELNATVYMLYEFVLKDRIDMDLS